MNAPKQESLALLVSKINNNEILLPDFQRKFTWTDETMQKQFIASVLSKMPLGSVLLLEANSKDYACKKLGCNIQVDSKKNETVELLLDGQQRITVLTNVFSSILFKNAGKVSNLNSPKLKIRYFLKIPTSDNFSINDIFCAKELKFPVEDDAEPSFLTSDIIDLIESKTFNASDSSVLNPYSNPSVTSIRDYCLNTVDGYFRIPLFLLLENDKTNVNRNCLRSIIDGIATSMSFSILQQYKSTRGKKSFAKKILSNEWLDQCDPNDEKSFDYCLDQQMGLWIQSIFDYLKSCVDEISLSQIVVDSAHRDRAIDIYENLNRGGVSLSIFDLIMARVAQVYKGDYTQRIIDYLNDSPKNYDINVVPDALNSIVKSEINNGYNASLNTECFKNGELSNAFIDAFLNVLAFIKCDNDLTIEATKRDDKLALKAEFINANTEIACKAIDRAMFFFQTRCGIRSINEINYKLMIPAVAIILIDDNNFNNKSVHNLLEAWYWSSIFSGFYDSDQNSKIVEHINKLKSSVASIDTDQYDTSWLDVNINSILDMKYFSDLDFWLYNDVERVGRTPKIFLRDVVCQYYLSKTYTDFFDKSVLLSVFNGDAMNFEKHHIIPLGSAKSYKESTLSLRKDEENYLNSPLNFVYITKESNKQILDKSLDDYQKAINTTSYSSLDFTEFNCTDDDLTRKKVLETRFKALQGSIWNEINTLL